MIAYHFRFTDEEKMMKEAVTKLANEEIKPYVSKMDKEAKMDPDVLQMLFDNGIMGIEIPEHFGEKMNNLVFVVFYTSFFAHEVIKNLLLRTEKFFTAVNVVLGGCGSSFMASILVVEEIAKVDPAIAVLVDIQNTLINTLFRKIASPMLQEKYLPRVRSFVCRIFYG